MNEILLGVIVGIIGSYLILYLAYVVGRIAYAKSERTLHKTDNRTYGEGFP